MQPQDTDAARTLEMRSRDEYEFQEFPKLLYRDRPKGYKAPKEGAWVELSPFETLIVNSAEEEAGAIDQGWRFTPTKAATNAKPA